MFLRRPIGHFHRGEEWAGKATQMALRIVKLQQAIRAWSTSRRHPWCLPPEMWPGNGWNVDWHRSAPEDMARHHAEPTESFEWYEVGKDVRNV